MKNILLTLLLLSPFLAQARTVNVLGDSYVANHRRPTSEAWHCLWAEQNGYTYNNYGRNGGCVAWDRTKDGFGPSLLVRYKQMNPDADLVIVIAGHNDAGMIRDSKDSLSMFADSLSLLIDRIRIQCPKAQVVWVTPWYVDRPGFEPTVKTIRQVCKQKGVPVLNNYSKKSPIKVRDIDFRHRYFQGPNDTAHLNAQGHQLFLPTANKWLKKVIDAE